MIYGVAITTFGLPPSLGYLASTSPNVLQTDNLPGKTRWGPTIIYFLAYGLTAFLGVAVAVLKWSISQWLITDIFDRQLKQFSSSQISQLVYDLGWGEKFSAHHLLIIKLESRQHSQHSTYLQQLGLQARMIQTYQLHLFKIDKK